MFYYRPEYFFIKTVKKQVKNQNKIVLNYLWIIEESDSDFAF